MSIEASPDKIEEYNNKRKNNCRAEAATRETVSKKTITSWISD